MPEKKLQINQYSHQAPTREDHAPLLRLWEVLWPSKPVEETYEDVPPPMLYGLLLFVAFTKSRPYLRTISNAYLWTTSKSLILSANTFQVLVRNDKKIQFPGMGCFSSVEITCSRGWQPACNKDNVTFSLILQDNSQKGMVGKYKYTQIYFPSTWLRAPPEGFFLNFFKPS